MATASDAAEGSWAQRPPLPARALSAGFDQLVRRGLRGVWVRGQLPAGGCIWAANHHSWWDGFLASAVLGRLHRRAALLMDGDNLGDYRFLAPVGVIPVDRPRRALQALRQGRVLVIYPEAELRPAGPLGELAPGAAWLARRAPAPVLPVAVRVVARGHQYPEALIDIGPACPPDRLRAELADRLAGLDAALAAGDPREPVPGFVRLIAGRPSWDERIDRWSRLARRGR
ncbi:lysophospholipid acyltransferase family protein [Jatrophihabitans sp.]|uniref:lysophospholipid acyltransferase family protein n=1 Tax=Jatrophihabitans sp. TaxID=1932789 RepID=UPI002CBF4D22|nr:lysophospholipid acyltransferase family protein [Jatrophihabitans sp.]